MERCICGILYFALSSLKTEPPLLMEGSCTLMARPPSIRFKKMDMICAKNLDPSSSHHINVDFSQEGIPLVKNLNDGLEHKSALHMMAYF